MKVSRPLSSMSMSKSTRASQVNASKINPLRKKSKEDDYITSLQKQVYYLELEMRLMKDRELETKNKVGGYEVLFRDGVPLNEHFLALKTKYTNERDAFEKGINDLKKDIERVEKENQNLQMQIDGSNKNYCDLIQNYALANEDYGSQIYDLNQKLFNENNTYDIDMGDKRELDNDLFKFNSENLHHTRTIEKNNLFKEDNEEKKEKLREATQNKFNDVDRLTEKNALLLDELEKNMLKNDKLKKLEEENLKLHAKITKLEGEWHLYEAKIKELENTCDLSRRYAVEEEMTRNVHLEENQELNDYLDDLSKLNEEKLKEKVKDHIEKQIIIIKNKVANSEIKMKMLIDKYKEEETEARNLLEEKNALLQKSSQIQEEITYDSEREVEIKRDTIDVNNNINQLDDLIEENTEVLSDLVNENAKYKDESEKYERDIKDMKIKIDELQQKLELNRMLKDVDITELKMLAQNNAVVNSSINDLMKKWDNVQQKLSEIEEKEKKENEEKEKKLRESQ
ncbi:MAG: hypothetical protein MJ252_20665 [archaeon]|nr:hypothetical protein [archaeon]